MKLYFDSHCMMCTKLCNFLANNSLGEITLFDIWESEYRLYSKETIVFVNEKK